MDVGMPEDRFPPTRRATYLNTGTLGPVPPEVMERYLDDLRSWNDGGPGNPRHYLRWRERAEDTRGALAAWLKVSPDTLTLTANVSEGLNIVVAGLRLPPGARVVTSDQEHGALVAPLARLAAMGTRVEIVAFGSGGPALTRRVRRALEAGPASLVALSHISSETGAAADAGALSRLCRAAGALLLLDGAQATGQIPLDLGEVAPDFYAFNGHKWMLAPVGSGGLYIRPEVQGRVALTFTGDGPAYATTYPSDMGVTLPRDGRRFEFGTRNWPAWAAWKDVLDLWTRIGPAWAYGRQRELASALREGLARAPAIRILSPPDAPGGIVTCALDGWEPHALFEAAASRGIVGRAVASGDRRGLRLCTSWFNDEGDVRRAVWEMSRLSEAGPSDRGGGRSDPRAGA